MAGGRWTSFWRRRRPAWDAEAAARRAARDPDGVAADRLKAQTQLIMRRFGDGVIGESPEGYLFRRGEVLVREMHLAEARVALRTIGATNPDTEARIRTVAPGVSLVPIEGDVLDTLRVLVDGGVPEPGAAVRVRGIGRGNAGPNTIVSVADAVSRCPATEPEPASGLPPLPPQTADLAAGTGIRVVVVDTGLDHAAAAATPWLAGVTGDPDLDVTPKQLLKYAGHGTFIAGVLRCVAPAAEVHVTRAFAVAGAAPETDLVQALEAALQLEPDIISLSAGTNTFGGAGLLTLREFYENRLRHHKGVALIAAAGNNASRVPFWPAAAEFAVSVGALSADLQSRAAFSNFGGWVDVFSPGTDLVNAFPTGRYVYDEAPNVNPPQPPREEFFDGTARWSGTSFATPIVAGLVAARMSRTGENGRTAAAALVAQGQLAAKVGVGAILLPS